MARSFNGTSDFGTAAVNLSAFTKLSICFWLWQNAFNNLDGLAVEYSVNAGANPPAFFIDPNSGSHAGLVEVDYISSAAHGHVVTLARPSAAAWHHWAVLIDASLALTQITHVYFDAVDQSLTAVQNNASAAGFGNFNMYFMSRAGTSLFNAGRMTQPVIYGNYLLKPAEVSALANGALPYRVNSSRPTSWWPVDGLASPEPDLSGAAKNMTITGTTLITGAPVMPFTPRWPQVNSLPLLAPAAGLGWVINRRNKLMVSKKRTGQ